MIGMRMTVPSPHGTTTVSPDCMTVAKGGNRQTMTDSKLLVALTLVSIWHCQEIPVPSSSKAGRGRSLPEDCLAKYGLEKKRGKAKHVNACERDIMRIETVLQQQKWLAGSPGIAMCD